MWVVVKEIRNDVLGLILVQKQSLMQIISQWRTIMHEFQGHVCLSLLVNPRIPYTECERTPT